MKRIMCLVLLSSVCAFSFAQGKVVAIELKYRSTSVETKELPDGKIEKTVKDFGFSDLNLQLRDLIVLKLNAKKIVATTDAQKEHDFLVRIHPVGSGLYSVLVEVFDKEDKPRDWRLFRGATQYFTDDVSTDVVTYTSPAS